MLELNTESAQPYPYSSFLPFSLVQLAHPGWDANFFGGPNTEL